MLGDADFKAKLIADPKATLAAEGINVPEGKELRIVENSPETTYVILPPPPAEGELSETELNKVAGGAWVPPP